MFYIDANLFIYASLDRDILGDQSREIIVGGGGNSLNPLIESGETVKILFGYYNCNEIEREDIITYNYSGNENPIIKIVKGLPEDKFSLEKVDGGYNILINDKISKNSKNQPYSLDERGYKMLSLCNLLPSLKSGAFHKLDRATL